MRFSGSRHFLELKKNLAANTTTNRAITSRTNRVTVIGKPSVQGPYENFFKPHAWLEARGLKPETLTRYLEEYYDNPARKSAYSGSVMLKIGHGKDGECVGYLSRNIGEVTQSIACHRSSASAECR